jgi:hypothetical protein
VGERSITLIGSRLVASRVRDVLQMPAENKTPDLFVRLSLDLNRDSLHEVQQGRAGAPPYWRNRAPPGLFCHVPIDMVREARSIRDPLRAN